MGTGGRERERERERERFISVIGLLILSESEVYSDCSSTAYSCETLCRYLAARLHVARWYTF